MQFYARACTYESSVIQDQAKAATKGGDVGMAGTSSIEGDIGKWLVQVLREELSKVDMDSDEVMPSKS